MEGEGYIIPLDATRLVVDVQYIPDVAFAGHDNIIEAICNGRVEKIGEGAFCGCPSLRRAIMPGVNEVKRAAFIQCTALEDVECGKVEIIRDYVFAECSSLRSINLPSVRILEGGAFLLCTDLTNVKFGSMLERIEGGVFAKCINLERITLPLKDGIITSDDIFRRCKNLSQVHLVEGEVHTIIASFDSEEWRNDMNREIDSINQILPNACAGYYDDEEEKWIEGEKAQVIRTWIRSVIDKMNHYKAEHQRLLNEAAALLEMAMWKATLDDTDGGRTMSMREGVRTTRGSVKRARRELCVTSGASIVIKNVLPFLELKA